MAEVTKEYLYNKSSKNISYCYYSGGWSSWSSSKLNGGYAGEGDNHKYCVALKFTTAAFEYAFKNFKLTVPYCRSSDYHAAKGTLLFKITKTDPRTQSLANAIKDCNIEAAWNATNSKGKEDKEMHTVNVTFTGPLEASTTYYIVIRTKDVSGSTEDWIEIGENADDDVLWKGTLTTYYTEGTKPTVEVSDNKNNKAVISGTLGKSGTSNAIKSATLYYTTDGSDPKNSGTRSAHSITATSGGSYSKTITITKACNVRAYIVCEFEHNTTDAATSANGVSILYYAAPTWLSGAKVKLSDSSFKNNRLTAKQDWGWEWTPANATNTNSTVSGYRVRFFVKRKDSSSFVNTKIIDYYDKKTVRSTIEVSAGDWAYDRTSDSYPMPMAAADFEQDIVPGDQIKLSVQAYSTNGVDTKLLAANRIESEAYTVQNAGIVNVKIGGEWKEGQVYVKISNEWKEAETVNVKISGEWKESQ